MAKTRSTLYTPEKVSAARRNIEHYEWARQIKDAAAAKADLYLNLGEDFLCGAVTPQSLPRSYAVNQVLGCPSCGKEHHRFGRWPWVADPAKHPWKLICPNPDCRAMFPTNDFAAYYESGKDANGLFRHELADKSLLENTLCPERGERWGVDDGFGWVDENGDRWTFIAFYNHWKIWIGMIDPKANKFPSGYPLGHGGLIENALVSFRDAYLYTGDERYARTGAALLNRIADVYPDMDCSVFRWEDGILNSHGMSGRGKIVGCIWETGLVRSFISAYDAFFPAIGDEAVRLNIETGILRQVLPGFRDGSIRGNNGMHQAALAMAAVVLDEPGTTEEWLDLVFRPGGLVEDESGRKHVTGGNTLFTLVHDIDRDGFGTEAAPSYNSLWVFTFKQVADILHGYDRYPQGDLYRHVKFQKMLRALFQLIMLDRYTVTIGDSESTGNPGVIGSLEATLDAYENLGDPFFAQAAYLLNGGSKEGLHGGIFSQDPERIVRELDKILQTRGPFKLASNHLTGYGFSSLRDGEGELQRDLWVYFGRNIGHGHRDTLNLGLHAFGLDLSPDLGYPEKCDGFTQKTHHWSNHTVSHNTVMVDRQKQAASLIGVSRLFGGSEKVQVFDVEAPLVYPQTSLYRRTTALVRIDDGNSYAVDLFRVKGGKEHHFIFHGAEGPAVAEGVQLAQQEGGTYAGADVEYAHPYDADPSLPLGAYKGSGFHYLYNVERASRLHGAFSVDWSVKDTWNVLSAKENIHLRFTMCTEVDDVALADGEPAQNRPGNPQKLRYLLARRAVSWDVAGDVAGELESCFVSVIEPYKNNRLIRSVERVPVKAVGSPAAGASGVDGGGGIGRVGETVTSDRNVDSALCGGGSSIETVAVKITLMNGRVDYWVHSLQPEQIFRVDNLFAFQGHVGFYSLVNGRPVHALLGNGEWIGSTDQPVISRRKSRLCGKVLDFTKELSLENEIRVKFDEAPLEASILTGTCLYVAENSGNAVYRIIGARKDERDGSYILDIGDVTPVRDWADAEDMSKGFLYDMAIGDSFSIPLFYEWNGQ